MNSCSLFILVENFLYQTIIILYQLYNRCIMDNVSSIAELLALSWTTISKLLSFINIRNEGYAIIKRRWGKPVKVYDMSERWCWKWPIAEQFDLVDIRKQVIYLNAHSIKNSDNKRFILPSNTTIDVQAEYRIVNPNVIYKISDEIAKSENNYTTIESYVDNCVHLIISDVIFNNQNCELTNANIQRKIHHELEKYNQNKPKDFCKEMDFDVNNGILIENIVIVSFDNNISLRKTE